MGNLQDEVVAVDFWSFIDLASHRLEQEVGPEGLDATRALLTLNRASDLITYDLESSIHRPRGWSWSGFRLMYVIWLAGPMEASRAARLTNMSRAAASSLIATLENRGMITREASPDDKRASVLSLTPQGLEEIREIYREQSAREREWVDALDDDEREQLVALLEKVISRRSAIDGRVRA